jgi:EamA domain-containing membrane protein RarD
LPSFWSVRFVAWRSSSITITFSPYQVLKQSAPQTAFKGLLTD